MITSAYAQYQEVKIGTINTRYKDILSPSQLKSIIQDIKNQFESQLGFKVFDYSQNGKPIHILYIQASQKKKELNRYIRDSDSIKEKLDTLNNDIKLEQAKSREEYTLLQVEVSVLNKSVTTLNTYIENANTNSEQRTKNQYNQLKAYVEDEQQHIKKYRKLFNKKQSHYNRKIKATKRKVSRHNALVRKFNSINRRIEVLSKSIVEIKGKAIGKNITSTITTIKNGETTIEKSTSIEMDRIEIYGFDMDLNYLKAVLAHEIGHLVGVTHSNESGALMNPRLQQNQIKKLDLTYSDIQGFYKAFDN